MRAFLADMLMFEKFDDPRRIPIVYPRYNPKWGRHCPRDPAMAVDHLLTRTAIIASCSRPTDVVNRPLGSIYQVQVGKVSGWEPVEFSPNADRAGILGQAGFLSLYAHSGRSSPTLRGRAIRELLLCQPVPNPPGNVNFTAVQDIDNKTMPSARIRLTAHNTDAVCSGCHSITDPTVCRWKVDGIGCSGHGK